MSGPPREGRPASAKPRNMQILEQLFSQFGVTWPKFIAQTIIFIVVYWFLNKFAFGPIVNVLGFMTGDRYLPDRRDLNRSFPG